MPLATVLVLVVVALDRLVDRRTLVTVAVLVEVAVTLVVAVEVDVELEELELELELELDVVVEVIGLTLYVKPMLPDVP